MLEVRVKHIDWIFSTCESYEFHTINYQCYTDAISTSMAIV
jgi:hypothetical protein